MEQPRLDPDYDEPIRWRLDSVAGPCKSDQLRLSEPQYAVDRSGPVAWSGAVESCATVVADQGLTPRCGPSGTFEAKRQFSPSPAPAQAALDRDILNFDPWDAGKGDDPYRLLRDEMIVALYRHECSLCFGWVMPGERYRARAEKNGDGTSEVKTFRFCPPCCLAMAASWTDEGRAITARYAIGERRASARPKQRRA